MEEEQDEYLDDISEEIEELQEEIQEITNILQDMGAEYEIWIQNLRWSIYL